jgi:hypothetical protein
VASSVASGFARRSRSEPPIRTASAATTWPRPADRLACATARAVVTPTRKGQSAHRVHAPTDSAPPSRFVTARGLARPEPNRAVGLLAAPLTDRHAAGGAQAATLSARQATTTARVTSNARRSRRSGSRARATTSACRASVRTASAATAPAKDPAKAAISLDPRAGACHCPVPMADLSAAVPQTLRKIDALYGRARRSCRSDASSSGCSRRAPGCSARSSI